LADRVPEQTPVVTLKGHKNWVLCCAVSPDGTLAASGSMDKVPFCYQTAFLPRRFLLSFI